MPDENIPKNLPVEGRSLLENVNGQVSPPNKPLAAPKPSLPPVRPAAAPAPVASRPAPPTPANLNEADDIFSDMKDQPVAPVPEKQNLKEETIVETPQKGFKKILITISSLVVLVAVLAGGGYWAYNQFLKPQALSPYLNLTTNSGTNANTNSAATTATTQTTAEQTTTTAQTALDSDNDGLTDAEEQKIGTDYLNPDTDGDLLFDGEEANVYKTDPLKKDTDGDGFEDGAEVKAGYDPNGLGKLIKIPAGS